MDRDAGASAGRTALALAAVAAAPLGFRLAALAAGDHAPALADLRGVLADGATALLVLSLVVALGRWSRAAAVAVVLVWTALHYANFETVRVLGSLAAVRDAPYLADPTFLRGSALVVSRPALLAFLLVAGALLAWVGLRAPSGATALRCFGVGALLLGVLSAWPGDDGIATWRQTHFLPHDARQLLWAAARPTGPPPGFPDPPAAMLDLVPELAADLDGEPRVPLPRPGTNVLLVVLESVSGAFLPSLTADHGLSFARGRMTELDAIASANLAWSSFVTHQRKTNRGLYAILCGELPNLVHGLPKMSDAAAGGWRTCLPEILRESGYRTAYLQAAPLAFMMKDQFLPSIGYERVLGREWFPRAYARGAWGVDDRAFLERSLDLLDELRAGEGPWFLTLLTVGTHHPFVLPPGYRTDLQPDTLRALAYLDRAVGAFARRLGERGVPDDTLVLYTSDESMGIGTPDATTAALAQNWGFLIAQVPGGARARVKEPFAQMDLALSILDYLGLAERGTHLFGRSVFRRYRAGRFVFFANGNLGRAGALTPEGRVLDCADDFRRCRRFAVPDGRSFGSDRSDLGWRSPDDDVLRELARRSVRWRERAPRRDFPLVTDSVVVAQGPEPQVIHGGQFVSLEPGEWLEVEIEVEARGPGAEAVLDHVLRLPNDDRLQTWNIRLRDGQTLRMHYTYAPEERADELGARSIVHVVRGSRVELDFHRARLSLHAGGSAPPPGVRVERLEVRPRL